MPGRRTIGVADFGPRHGQWAENVLLHEGGVRLPRYLLHDVGEEGVPGARVVVLRPGLEEGWHALVETDELVEGHGAGIEREIGIIRVTNARGVGQQHVDGDGTPGRRAP